MKKKNNLQKLIQEGEGSLVEFKESAAHLQKDICAFANANGGTIYLGISDQGMIKPIRLTNRLKAELQTAARQCDPSVDIDVFGEADIISIQVVESTNKPIRAHDGFYLRMGATSQKLSRDEILAFAIQENKIRFDSQLYVKEPASDLLAIRRLEAFRSVAQISKKVDNMQLLQNLDCLQYQKDIPYLTHAGILLFGNNPQRLFAQATVTLLHMQDPATILEQHIIEGTLFEQADDVLALLKRWLRVRPRIQGLIRENILELPEFVIRELIVNALIHRDYFEASSDVVIKVFPQAIEFANPGHPSKSVSLESLFGKSFRRNPLIADIFFHANYIERAGTGLLRVRQILEENKLLPLILREDGVFFVATLPRPQALDADPAFNERQRNLFTISKNFFPFTTEDYVDHFHISERMARLDIKQLVDRGLLAVLREGRRISYQKR